MVAGLVVVHFERNVVEWLLAFSVHFLSKVSYLLGVAVSIQLGL